MAEAAVVAAVARGEIVVVATWGEILPVVTVPGEVVSTGELVLGEIVSAAGAATDTGERLEEEHEGAVLESLFSMNTESRKRPLRDSSSGDSSTSELSPK